MISISTIFIYTRFTLDESEERVNAIHILCISISYLVVQMEILETDLFQIHNGVIGPNSHPNTTICQVVCRERAELAMLSFVKVNFKHHEAIQFTTMER